FFCSNNASTSAWVRNGLLTKAFRWDLIFLESSQRRKNHWVCACLQLNSISDKSCSNIDLPNCSPNPVFNATYCSKSDPQSLNNLTFPLSVSNRQNERGSTELCSTAVNKAMNSSSVFESDSVHGTRSSLARKPTFTSSLLKTSRTAWTAAPVS